MEPHQEETNKHPGLRPTSAAPGASKVQPMRNRPPSYPVERMVFRVVAIYVIVAALWILVSDQVLVALVPDHGLLVKLEVAKGWFFVAVTAALLFVLLRRETGQWIAERKAREEAEAVTQESERRFRLLFDLAPIPFSESSREGRVVSFNARFTQVFGYTMEDIPTIREWWVLAYPDEKYRKQVMASWEAVVTRMENANADVAPEELRITCKNGEVRTFLASASKLRDGALAAFVDITERKRAEDAVHESEARYRLLAEHMADVVWIYDIATSRFVYVSPSIERLRGYTSKEVCEETMEQALMPVSYAMVKEKLPGRLAAYQAGDPAAVTQLHEVEQSRKDGSTVWTEVSTTFVTPPSGAIQLLGISRDITARRQAEEALRKSEERFRTLVETAPDAIFIQTRGCFAYLNAAAVRLFGAENAGHLIGTPVLDQIHPDYRVKAAERIRQFNELQRAQPRNELRIVRSDKTMVDAETSGVPFVFQGEHGALVFAHDITARKRAEEKLRFQDALLNETGQIANVGGWSFDPATGEGYWTDQVARIHDLDPADPTSKDVGLKYFQGESQKRIEAAIKEAIAHGTPYDLELELTTAKGNRKWVRTIGHPVEENGKITRVRGSFQDITELKAGEAALRESEERFRQMAENIDGVFWMMGVRAEEMLYVSPAYKKIWGREAKDLFAGRETWSETIHPDDRNRVVDAVRSKAAAGEYDETYRILRPDGAVRWIHDRAFPIRDQAGRVYRVVGMANDITEQRTLEEQLRQAQKMEAIGTLAGGIAHDFNNILGAIYGFAELAKMDAASAPIQNSLDEILKACKRAGDLVRQILAFSRHQEQKRQPLQLWRIVDEATRLLRAALPTTIQFDIDLSADAPAVLAEPTQIHQIVMNLCTNAAHAMAGRPGVLGVKLDRFEADEEFVALHHGSRSGGYARLTVSDNGHGMDRATLDRIYEPFFTTKAPGEGTGLGLSVVHGIVRNHDGIVTVYSQPGKGTTFHVYFPAHEGGVAELAVDSVPAPRGQGQRILLVDDEVPLVQMTERVLKRLGYVVDTETDPKRALEAIRAEPKKYDLVLTDLTMPGLSGLELAAFAVSANRDIKVILMTGYFANVSTDQVSALGIKEVLMKPISIRSLAQTVSRVLGQPKTN